MRLLHYEGTFKKSVKENIHVYIYIYIGLENRCKNEKAPKGNWLDMQTQSIPIVKSR